MINHYIDLHEYINENIYRLPVKENQIITEAINWGGVIKNTLIGGGIIGLIILLFKILGGNNSSGGSSGGGSSSSASSSTTVSILTFKINDNKKIYESIGKLLLNNNNDIYSIIDSKYDNGIKDQLNNIITKINNLKFE